MTLDRPSTARIVHSLVTAGLNQAGVARGNAYAPPTHVVWPDDPDLRAHIATTIATFFDLYDDHHADQLLLAAGVPSVVDIVMQATARGVRQVTFRDAAAARAPRLHRHPTTHLAQEADAWAMWLQGRVDRVLLDCPAHRFDGFIWGVLLPPRLGVDVVDAGTAFRTARVHARDLLVGGPEALCERLGAGGLEAGFIAVDPSGELPSATAIGLQACGAAAVIELSAHGRAGTIGWRNRAAHTPRHDDQPQAFVALPYWRGDAGVPHAAWRRLPDGRDRRYALPFALTWTDSRHFLRQAPRPAARDRRTPFAT